MATNTRVVTVTTSKPFVFIGEADINVLSGVIDVDGFRIRSSEKDSIGSHERHHVKSAAGAPFATIRAVKDSDTTRGTKSKQKETTATIEVKVTKSRSGVRVFLEHVFGKILFNPSGAGKAACVPDGWGGEECNSCVPVNQGELIVPKQWEETVSEFVNNFQKDDLATSSLVVCGGRNSGKSSMCRWVVNRLLGRFETVGVLDCDLGQSEFTPGGMVSLHRVRKPVFGPPYLHQRASLSSHFIGSTTPKDDPKAYVEGIFSLFDTYTEERQSGALYPLVVNTHGWIKGLGLPMLCDMLRYIQPAVIVQLDVSAVGRNLPDLTATSGESMIVLPKKTKAISSKIIKLSSAVPQSQVQQKRINSLEAKISRALSLAVHLCGFGGSLLSFNHIACLQPYAVPFESVAISFTFFSIPETEVLRALNASIVGLVSDPNYRRQSKLQTLVPLRLK
eukprot:m.243761 g.243761  ORF g.243761 m.243761 type:complete len:449 (+) comp16098_c0_seq34:165-1511(+)